MAKVTTLLRDEVEAPAVKPLAAAERAVVSIVIVTWNSAGWIERCLASLPAACGDVPYDVVVYDNASGDATAAIVEEIAPARLRLERGEKNYGFAGGVNRAIARATGELVLLLNPDCELLPGSVKALVQFLDRNRDCAAAVPLLLGEDGEPQREFQLRRLPSLRTLTAELLLLDKIVPTNGITAGYRYRDLDISAPRPIEQPAAAAMMLRRSTIDQIGEFDERFQPAWFEDVDYCRRMSGARASVWLVPAATATHHGGASLEHVSFGRFTEVWYANLFRYSRKWLPPARVEVLRWVIMAGMVLRIGALSLGLSRRDVPRREALAAYRSVLAKAFDRWDDDASLSS